MGDCPFALRKFKNKSLLASNFEHCCATNFTNSFCSFLTIFHGNFLSIFSFSLGSTFYTVHHKLSPPLDRAIHFRAKYTTTSKINMRLVTITLLSIPFLVDLTCSSCANRSALFAGFDSDWLCGMARLDSLLTCACERPPAGS